MRYVLGGVVAIALFVGSIAASADGPARRNGPPDGNGPPGERHGPREPPAWRPPWRAVPPTPYPYPYVYPYGYPWGPPYYDGVYILPPVWIPAEGLFGPQAMRRFAGPEAPPAPHTQPDAAMPGGPAGEPAVEKDPSLRGTNRESLDRAWRFIGYGDAHFENQKYVDANQRYRKATEVSPRLAEGYFRQGYAQVALGRYDAAAKAFKRGLGIDPDWPKSNFRANDLYGQNQLAKAAHLDALADAAAKEPNSPDMLFLVGLLLHFDGQQARAKPFLQRAIQLAAGDDAHLRAFP